ELPVEGKSKDHRKRLDCSNRGPENNCSIKEMGAYNDYICLLTARTDRSYPLFLKVKGDNGQVQNPQPGVDFPFRHRFFCSHKPANDYTVGAVARHIRAFQFSFYRALS